MVSNGEKNNNWKGGVTKTGKGYYLTYSPDHPNKYRNYVRTHRLIYEHYLKILFDEDVYIPLDYDIHHINGIKTDNSLINLQLVTKKEHSDIHKIKDKSNRVCLKCGSKTTYIDKKGYHYWFIYKSGFVCNKCYKK